jgi:hypothetical protein
MIEQIAMVDGLVVYVGSGVTIDDTGSTWSSMLVKVAEQAKVNLPHLQRFEGILSAPQIATMVFKAIQKKFPTKARIELAKTLGSTFYEENNWRNSQFSRAVILMAEHLVLAGKPVFILTTNYDTYLENKANDLQGEGLIERIRVSSYLLDADDADDETASGQRNVREDDIREVPVVHLHGRVQLETDVDDASRIVFSESDYFESEQVVFEFVEGLFAKHDVLILGSAIDDAPLVRALALTRTRAEANGRSRWAVLPRQSFDLRVGAFECSTPDDPDDVLSLLAGRAEQLGLSLLIPDFFSQAAQVPREIGRAAKLLAVGETYAKGRDDYQHRINEWWKQWLGEDPSDHEIEQHQTISHQVLRDAVDRFRQYLENPDELIKLEMWVRQAEQRDLTLWASSTGTWPDRKIARKAPIEHQSSYAASEIFCAGVARLIDTSSRSDRWGAYFGTPIRVGDVIDSVTVGVLTIASGKDSAVPTKLDESESAVLARVLSELTSVGNSLVALDHH